MAGEPATEWNGPNVRKWLASRIESARADQAAAARGGRSAEDDSDKAAAEEMVCMLFGTAVSTDLQGTFATALREVLDREDYHWRGVCDDDRFDRHVRTYVRKLLRMTKRNDGWQNLARYQ